MKEVDIKASLRFIRRHLVSVLLVLGLSCGAITGAVVYGINEYNKDLSDRKDALLEKEKAFELHKNEAERKNLAREAELNQKEFLQQQRDRQYNENLAALQQRTADNRAAEVSLKEAAVLVSERQQEKDAENKLTAAMAKFSELGEDITAAPPCDPERRRAYNAAQAKFSEAKALALANNLYGRYSRFFSDHQSNMVFVTCQN